MNRTERQTSLAVDRREGDKLIESIFVKKEPNQDEIYLGISDVKFDVDNFNFGQGVLLRSTYAYIFAPYMAAFKRPVKPGQPSPGPWKTVSGGQSKHVNYELYIPLDFEVDEWFDRLNTAWWLTALLRLKGSSYITAPVASNFSFSVIGEMDLDASFTTIEFNNDKLPITDDQGKPISAEDLEWVRSHWQDAGMMFRNSESFSSAFLAADRCLHEQRPSVAMVIVWGALERLFADFKQELNYRVSLNIVTYLEKPGEGRSTLFKKVKKLYGSRSKAAHGSPTEDYEEFKESYMLLKRALVRMIEEKHVPNTNDIERLILYAE